MTQPEDQHHSDEAAESQPADPTLAFPAAASPSDPEPDYPAQLEVPYPERLSRGLVLVKWWLLAIPHYLVLVFFVGAGFGWDWGSH